MRANTPVTWDEAELLEANMVAKHGTADAQTLGVTPQPMSPCSISQALPAVSSAIASLLTATG